VMKMTHTNHRKKTVKLDEYETYLEENADKAKPLSQKGKKQQLSVLKTAVENYAEKDK